jgi:hypothetical protein
MASSTGNLNNCPKVLAVTLPALSTVSLRLAPDTFESYPRCKIGGAAFAGIAKAHASTTTSTANAKAEILSDAALIAHLGRIAEYMLNLVFTSPMIK